MSYDIKGKRKTLFLAEKPDSDPLRLKNLMAFLIAVKRSTQCPHCDHKGGWEISLNEVEGEDAENPRLSLITNATLDGETHTAAAMTCPKCGHLATISTYKIREHMTKGDQSNG